MINPELNQKSVLTLPPWEAARFPRYIFSEFLMYKFQVNDMTCGHCASTVDKAVKSVDAAAQVTIDLPAHQVEIRSEKPASVFAAAIADAGYTGTLQG